MAQLLSLQSLIARHSSHQLSASKIKQLDSAQLESYLTQPAALYNAQQLCLLLNYQQTRIKAIEDYVEDYCLAHYSTNYQLITSIPGVGKILGLTIVLETGTIERFKKVGHYASYARCVPTEKISNGKVKGRGNKRNGNKYLGKAFVEAAHYATIWDETIKTYYQRKTKKLPLMVAKKIIANKLTRACYHMLKGQTPFDAGLAFYGKKT